MVGMGEEVMRVNKLIVMLGVSVGIVILCWMVSFLGFWVIIVVCVFGRESFVFNEGMIVSVG